MTPEAQRIAIAEACGWTTGDCTVCGVPGYVARSPSSTYFWDEASSMRSAALIRVIPDYPNDLNAMHEALGTLKKKEWHSFLCELEHILGFNTGPGGWDLCQESLWAFVSASPAQQAEAFLKHKGLWKP